MSDALIISDEAHVRTLRLNRPEKKNALSDELAWGIVTAVEQAARDDAVWVVAITGTGDAFCSGLDLGGTGESASPLTGQTGFMDDVGWVGRFALVLRELCDKPIVGGLNGVAAGAGLSLAMACDIRIGAERLRLIAGYPRIGASPDGGLTWTLPQAIGYEQAMRFLLENRTVDADEALRLGFVGEIVADDAFDARLAQYCAFLAERSPIASRLTKRGITRATRIDLEDQVRFELANTAAPFRRTMQPRRARHSSRNARLSSTGGSAGRAAAIGRPPAVIADDWRPGDQPMTLVEFIKAELTRLHAMLDRGVADLTPEQWHAIPGDNPAANHIAFEMWHYARTEDNIVRYIIQARKPTVWMEGGWAEKLSLPPVAQGTGMPAADAQALCIADLDAFKRYTQEVWQSTASWLANPDTSVFDTPVMVKPLGEMPAIRALGQVCMTHGFTHLGELELCRTLLGLRPAIGV